MNLDKKDILGYLINAKDNETGEQLSEIILARNLISFMAAAYETTAHAMAFVISHLANNSEILHRVRKEIDGVWSSNKEKMVEEDYDKLDYLQACINESNRLSNVVLSVFRVCEEDTEIGDFTIPKGTSVCVPFSVMHKSLKHWNDPDKFIPQRFFNSNTLKYFNPFTIGPRQCLGNSLAKLQMKMILATFIRNYEFETVPGQNYETTFEVTHFFKNPFEIIMRKRNH